MSARPPRAPEPTLRQLLRQMYRNMMGIKVEKPQAPKAVPNLFIPYEVLDPSLARRIVTTVLAEIEAAGGFIAIAILSSVGNPIICEKSIHLGEAFWQLAIDRARALARESNAVTANATEAAATLMNDGFAAGFIGVASPDAKVDKKAIDLALMVLTSAVNERHQAIAFNIELAKAKAAKNPPKTCRSCGRPLR